MKKTQVILGLPIISIFNGTEVGKVKNLIINAEKGVVEYIVIDSGIQIFSARVISNDDVVGIGEYALTIENEGVITEISKIPDAIQWLQKDILVKGTKVLTKKGSLIGEIGDIYINEDDKCIISGLEFISDKEKNNVRIIPRDSVITYSKNLTIVKDDVESTLVDNPLQLVSGYTIPDAIEKIYNLNTDESDMFIKSDSTSDTYGNEVMKETAAADVELTPDMPAFSEAGNDQNAAELFEQRQRQYLKGRKATKTIADTEGNVIIEDCMVIDDAAIDDAKLKGKLIELVMNNKA